MASKRSYLLCILLFLTGYTYAQPYKSMFGSKATEWFLLQLEFIDPMGPMVRANDNFFYQKDTVVKGLTYKKVDIRIMDDCMLYREDLDAGKVWYIPPGKTDELPFMDYTLQVGDTFNFTTYNIAEELKIVDSVYQWKGRKHIRLAYKEPYTKKQLTLVEGVGWNLGLITAINNYAGMFHYDIQLLCFYQDGYLAYSSVDSCKPFGTGIIEPGDSPGYVLLSPNPVKDELKIKSRHNITALIIRDMQGRTIRKAVNAKEVNVSGLPAGVYLLQMETEGQAYYEKFVKE